LHIISSCFSILVFDFYYNLFFIPLKDHGKSADASHAPRPPYFLKEHGK